MARKRADRGNSEAGEAPAIQRAFLADEPMLAARGRGLHTCPEAAIASYPDIVRRELGISSDNMVICGMAMGYADPQAIVNTFQPPRIELSDYALFLD